MTTYAELARLGRVTRARMTEVMSLLSLASDMQEEILFLPPTRKGRDRFQARFLELRKETPMTSKKSGN